VALPGALVGLALLPLVDWIAQLLQIHLPVEVPETVSVALLAGIALSLLNDAIYQFYEGRLLWPEPVCRLGIRAMQRHRDALYRRVTEAYAKTDHSQYDALSDELRHGFPTNEAGAPVVSAPTLMGNILASYESYPLRRYDIPGAFFWTRLWLLLDKDVRDEVDGAWAETDGLMHLAAGLLTAGSAYALAFVGIATGQLVGIQPLASVSAPRTALFALALIAGSYLAYWMSLPGHVRNGELYKSIFDLHHTKLTAVAPPTDAERAALRAAWAALEYGRR
jgi:hypothetical protein